MMLLSQLASRSGFKVAISGEGADEVFAGYDIFKEAKIRRFLASQPDSRLRPRVLKELYPYMAASPARSVGLAQKFFMEGRGLEAEPWFSQIPRWTVTGRVRQFLSAEVGHQLDHWKPEVAIATLFTEDMREWEPLGRDLYTESQTLLSAYLLSSQGDRVAMANAIEGRVPYLDHELIELVNRMPAKFKLRGLKEKYILRRAFSDMLPREFSQRTKQPYRAPDSQSFFPGGRAVDYVDDCLSRASLADAGYFEPRAVGRLVEKCRKGAATGYGDNMAFVTILSTMLLHRQYVCGNPGSAT